MRLKADRYAYKLPEDCERVLGVRLNRGAYSEYVCEVRSVPSERTRGKPDRMAVYLSPSGMSSVIEFWPIPDKAYRVEIDYYKRARA